MSPTKFEVANAFGLKPKCLQRAMDHVLTVKPAIALDFVRRVAKGKNTKGKSVLQNQKDWCPEVAIEFATVAAYMGAKPGTRDQKGIEFAREVEAGEGDIEQVVADLVEETPNTVWRRQR